MKQRRLLLHIGSPKTGTTTLQATLDHNRARLAGLNVLVPEVLGQQSHILLTAYAQPDGNFRSRHRAVAGVTNKEELDAFRARLRADFADALDTAGDSARQVIITSESLSNTLRKCACIERVRDFVQPHFDEIELLYYVRRQDLRAVSDYDQAIKAGNPRDGFFTRSFAYEYHEVFQLWSDVFRGCPFNVRVFDPKHLIGGDVVLDFFGAAGLDAAQMEPLERRNTSLSAKAQLALLALHRAAQAEGGKVPRRDYRRLLDQLRAWFPGKSPLRPARHEAEAFFAQFDDANAALFDAAGISGFDSDFSMYPDAPPPMADLEAESVAEMRNRVGVSGGPDGKADRALVTAVLERSLSPG